MTFRFRKSEEEDRIQAECFDLIAVGCCKSEVLAFSVPNGGFRDKRTAEKMKITGQYAGMTDIVLIGLIDKRMFFVEIKTKKGALSKAQREFRDFCKAARLPWAIVRSRDEMQLILSVWGLLKPGYGGGPLANDNAERDAA